jgi:spore germination cell wall hydrolase CwlJ-like protein
VSAAVRGGGVALAAWGAVALQWARRRPLVATLGLAALVVVFTLALAHILIKPPSEGPSTGLARAAGDLSDRAFHRYVRRLDGSVIAIADRHAPGARVDLWGKPVGWSSLDISQAPSLGFGALTDEDARAVNALIPTVAGVDPAPPFILKSTGPERDRAVKCLTQAIYYEAALEPTEGQAAVAQVVLNRMRHPAYPKTICGVVYQGAIRYTGCQFSFTCDGSVLRAPQTSYWERAKAVAERALAGYVQRDVGTATFYHADYVYPSWGPLLVKLNQIGAHIFYRFPGPWGRVEAMSGRYLGNELKVSLEVHNPADTPLIQEGLAPPGFESFSIAQAATDAPTDANGRVRGVIAGRRTPSPDEIKRINALLSAMPEAQAAPPAAVAPPTPAKTDLSGAAQH